MYGCKNRAPYVSAIPVQDGWYMDGYTRTPRMVSMPFRMSPDCVYSTSDLGQKDKGCDGCKWRKADVEMVEGTGGVAEPSYTAPAATGTDSDHA